MPLEFADPDIEAILRTYPLETLHASDETIYALRPDLILVYVNRGWSKFAAANRGQPAISKRWPLGSSIQGAIPEILRPFFADNFAKCLETGSPWQHRYECSSSDEYREFLMTSYPLGHRKGLLVVNSLYQNSPHNRPARAPLEQNYRDHHGMILQCVHCRRVKRQSSESVWDWVPDWLDSYPDNTSHGLCEPCFGYFYRCVNPLTSGYPKFARTEH